MGGKIAFKDEDKIRSFSDNEKLRKCGTNTTSPEENTMHVLRAEGKELHIDGVKFKKKISKDTDKYIDESKQN